jgi:hypothetical protein
MGSLVNRGRSTCAGDVIRIERRKKMTECKCHSYAGLMHAYVVMLEKDRDFWKANQKHQVATKRVAGEFRDRFKRERDEAREEIARLRGWEGPQDCKAPELHMREEEDDNTPPS